MHLIFFFFNFKFNTHMHVHTQLTFMTHSDHTHQGLVFELKTLASFRFWRYYQIFIIWNCDLGFREAGQPNYVTRCNVAAQPPPTTNPHQKVSDRKCQLALLEPRLVRKPLWTLFTTRTWRHSCLACSVGLYHWGREGGGQNLWHTLQKYELKNTILIMTLIMIAAETSCCSSG